MDLHIGKRVIVVWNLQRSTPRKNLEMWDVVLSTYRFGQVWKVGTITWQSVLVTSSTFVHFLPYNSLQLLSLQVSGNKRKISTHISPRLGSASGMVLFSWMQIMLPISFSPYASFLAFKYVFILHRGGFDDVIIKLKSDAKSSCMTLLLL